MNPRQTTLNVLGYKDGDEVVALALEMDLRGYGATFDEALDDLKDLVRMQLGFALFKHGSLDMAYFPAAPPSWRSLRCSPRRNRRPRAFEIPCC